MRKIEFKKIKPSVIVRGIMEILVLINTGLAMFGKGLPFTSDVAYQIITYITTAAVAIWAFWKNNDITSFACLAGKLFNALKDGEVTPEEANDLLNSADALVSAESDDTEEEDEDSDKE